jgi:hypothetical protein
MRLYRELGYRSTMVEMGRSTRAQINGAVAIIVIGSFVAAAPVVWTALVWPGQDDGAWWGWWVVFVPSVIPFGLAALLRGTGGIRRTASVVAMALATALVILGQAAGLNPNDPSSTASIAVLILPIYAAIAVLVVWGADNAVAGLMKSWRSRRAPNRLA